jgi:hypothetical protein
MNGIKTFDGKLLQICPYYHELQPVMGDRAAAKPKATSESLFGGFQSDSNSEDDDLSPNDLDKFPAPSVQKRKRSASSSLASVGSNPKRFSIESFLHDRQRDHEMKTDEKRVLAKEKQKGLQQRNLMQMVRDFNELKSLGYSNEAILVLNPEFEKMVRMEEMKNEE